MESGASLGIRMLNNKATTVYIAIDVIIMSALNSALYLRMELFFIFLAIFEHPQAADLYLVHLVPLQEFLDNTQLDCRNHLF